MVEFSKILIRSDKDFNSRLDQAASENAQLHREQLSQASLEHERIREGAELERRRLIAEQELQQAKREEEQRIELERIEREKAKQEAEARERQRAREQEIAQRAAAEERQKQEAEAKLKAQKEQEEAIRRQKAQQDEADKKAKDEAAAAENARIQAAKQPPPAAPQTAPVPAPPAPKAQSATPQVAVATDVEKIHSGYLELHQRMKAFWKPFKDECSKKDHPMKAFVGDMRREMRLATGQVNVNRADTKVLIQKLRDILHRAQAAGGPTVDIRQFIVSHPIPTLSNESEAQYSAVLLYGLICFEKFVIKQFDQEAANEDGRIVAELGAIAASLFVDKSFAWKDIPMTDLILAKFHRACPILFGISGSMNTKEGQARLGWFSNEGPVNPNFYHQRMAGLGCGYAAMTLRNVPAPAIPISEYWRAIASISNTPSSELQAGHFSVLKGLVKDSVRKFLVFYGVHAKAVLRQATIVLPSRAPPGVSEAAGSIRVLPEIWKKSNIVALEALE